MTETATTMNHNKALSSNDDESIVRRVNKQIAQIDYDFSNFTIPAFAQWVAEQRGIEIRLDRCDDLNLPGFWFVSDDGAYIKYSSHLPGVLETITILHELLHIYFGHMTLHVPSDSIPLIAYRNGMAARDPFQKGIEDREAEIGAILLYQRIVESTQETNRTTQVPRVFDNIVDI